MVNDRISEIAREHPDCKITTEYARNEPMEEELCRDVYHLLWSSDRREIAREVDSRITKIYADLVSLEKMMHYKRSIIDVLKDVLPELTRTRDAGSRSWKNAMTGGRRMHGHPVADEAEERRYSHETHTAGRPDAARPAVR